jgi:hypothetical protein
MTDKSNPQEQAKTDWSLTDSVATSETVSSPHGASAVQAAARTELLPSDRSSVPPAPSVALPDNTAPQGILTRWRENKLGRKAALRALEAHYDSQLDALTHSLGKAVQVQKARADVIAGEYLRELDARQLEMLAELGLRNKDTRERALLELTEMTAAKLREVQDKDWPAELVRDTIGELLALRKRVVAEIMKELGGAYSDD